MAQSQTNFEVTIEKLVYGGDGLARLDGHVVLAPFVLPGERAAVEAVEQKPGLVRAKLDRGARRGRRSASLPPCPYFARCGGCHYQHAVRGAACAEARTFCAKRCGAWARSSRRKKSA